MKPLLITGLFLSICTVDPLWVNVLGVVMMGIAVIQLTHAERGHQGKPCQESNCGDKTLDSNGRHRCLPPLREGGLLVPSIKKPAPIYETRTEQ